MASWCHQVLEETRLKVIKSKLGPFKHSLCDGTFPSPSSASPSPGRKEGRRIYTAIDTSPLTTQISSNYWEDEKGSHADTILVLLV